VNALVGADQCNQHHCANEGDDDAAYEADATARKQKAEQEPANKRADYADDNVANDAVATAPH
jgi:hypothetical protein